LPGLDPTHSDMPHTHMHIKTQTRRLNPAQNDHQKCQVWRCDGCDGVRHKHTDLQQGLSSTRKSAATAPTSRASVATALFEPSPHLHVPDLQCCHVISDVTHLSCQPSHSFIQYPHCLLAGMSSSPYNPDPDAVPSDFDYIRLLVRASPRVNAYMANHPRSRKGTCPPPSR
jgi:hypothetical protein